MNGDYTRTRAKKLSLLYKVTAKMPFTQLLGQECNSHRRNSSLLQTGYRWARSKQGLPPVPLRSPRLFFCFAHAVFFSALPGARPDRAPHSFFSSSAIFFFLSSQAEEPVQAGYKNSVFFTSLHDFVLVTLLPCPLHDFSFVLVAPPPPPPIPKDFFVIIITSNSYH